MLRVMQNLLMVIVSCLVAVLIAEAFIRVVSPRVLIEPLGIVLDKNLIYRFPANESGAFGPQVGEWYMHAKTNSHGLRDREIPFQRTPGVFRILGLGDSMTFGEGAELDEIYLKRLESKLARLFPVEVINAAVRGWGPDQELAFMSMEGYRYHPDLTLIGFYSANDFSDVLHGGLYRVENGEAVHQPVDEEASTKYRYYKHQIMIQNLPLYGWMMSHSHLANWLRQIYPYLAISNIYRRKTDHKVNFEEMNDTEEERSWVLVKAIYEKLFRMREKTGNLFVILIPDIDEIRRGSSPRIEKMIRLCRQWDVPFLDMLSGFRDEVDAKDNLNELYFPVERHLAPAGHAVVSHLLEEKLKAEGMLPGERSH